MTDSLQLTINGSMVVHVEDTDAETVARSLRVIAESIERFGMRAALAALQRSAKLQEAVFTEAQCGGALLSTLVA